MVPPSELHRAHLIAEYRELPRIFTQARKAWERGERHDDPRNPNTYTLGTGHVRFFYPRLQFLHDRQHELVEEMRRRGYKPTFDPTSLPILFEEMPEVWLGHYSPTPDALRINRERILLRAPKGVVL